jgi:type I restriction enzyme S subunit
MDLSPGYKQTEVGLIPEEWEVKPFGECLTGRPRYGINAAAVPYSDNLPVYIRITDISEDGRFMPENTVSVKSELSEHYFLSDGDIVFARTGASVGKSYRYDTNDGPLVFAGFLIRAQPDVEKLLPKFAAAYVTTGNYWRWVRLMSMRSGQPGINGNEYSQLPIPVPPLPEQRAIATALSDVNKLLSGLDQLIAKRRDVKQAVMQELLTGKQRLPKFSGEWEVKRLGDLFNFSGGYSASRDQLSAEGHCYLHYGDIHGSTKTCIDTDTDFQNIPKLEIPLKRVSSASLLDDGDVVFVDASEDDAGTSKHVVVVNKAKKPFISGLHTIVAKSKTDELSHEFRRYCFQTPAIRQQFLFYSVGTKVSGISKSNISKLTLSFPSVPEQIAIAEVLSDMDAELTSLEQRRQKTRALKQGMMQELLTGRTRLI